MSTPEEPKDNVGVFVCSCLWTGPLEFDLDEVEKLDGNIRNYMGPCPACGQNQLTMAQDRIGGGKAPWDDDDVDGLLDVAEAAAGDIFEVGVPKEEESKS